MVPYVVGFCLALVVAVGAQNYTLETDTSLYVWTTSPSFRMYPKNAFGFVVWDVWTDVKYDSISRKTLGLLELAPPVPFGNSGWTFRVEDAPDGVPATEKLVAWKIMNGGNVTFEFFAVHEDTTIESYIDIPITKGALKMLVSVKDWNFNLLDGMLEFNWELEFSDPIDDTNNILTDLLGTLLRILTFSTNKAQIHINSSMLYLKDGGLVELLLDIVGGLLDVLLNQNNGKFYYRFVGQFNHLIYDPDYSILLTIEPNCAELNECNGKGTCVYDNYCDCRPGWMGEDCSEYSCVNGCSGRGTCMPTEPPSCECDDHWKGTDCSIADCPGYPDCSSRGVCIISQDGSQHTCDCSTGWTGTICEIPQCPGDCSGNGNCSSLTNPPKCICASGFVGEDCSIKLNCTEDSLCNHGKCSEDYSSCECDDGWTGSDCTIALCPGYNAATGSPNCGGRGECNTDEVPHTCLCPQGWSGETCSKINCPNDCSEHGVCTPSIPPQCLCDDGWASSDCSVPIEKALEPTSSGINDENPIESQTKILGMPIITFMVVVTFAIAVIAVLISFAVVEIYRRKIRREEQRVLRIPAFLK